MTTRNPKPNLQLRKKAVSGRRKEGVKDRLILRAVPAKLRAGYLELAGEMRKYWKGIFQLSDRRLANLQKGDAFSFLGANPRKCRQMAQDWYGRAHAEEMASRTIGKWVEALRPMLDSYVAEVLESEGGNARGAFIGVGEFQYFVRNDTLAASVDPFRSWVPDDIYERTASGCSVGGIIGIIVSTGEGIAGNPDLIKGIFSDFEFGWQMDGRGDSWKLTVIDEDMFEDHEAEGSPWYLFGWPADGRTIFVQVDGIEPEDWHDMCWPTVITKVSMDGETAHFPGEDVIDLLRRKRMRQVKSKKPGYRTGQRPRPRR